MSTAPIFAAIPTAKRTKLAAAKSVSFGLSFKRFNLLPHLYGEGNNRHRTLYSTASGSTRIVSTS